MRSSKRWYSIVSEDEKDLWRKYWAMEAAGTEEFLVPKREEQEVSIEKCGSNSTLSRTKAGWVLWPPAVQGWNPPLPGNRALSYKRLANIWSSLKKSEELLDQYNEAFMDELNKNIVEVVDGNYCVNGTQVHYIPHQPVLTPQKATSKLRIAFDASAH